MIIEQAELSRGVKTYQKYRRKVQRIPEETRQDIVKYLEIIEEARRKRPKSRGKKDTIQYVKEILFMA